MTRKGRWTAEEHRLFLQGMEQHGKGWKKIATLLKSRTVVQIRSHAQKYFQARDNIPPSTTPALITLIRALETSPPSRAVASRKKAADSSDDGRSRKKRTKKAHPSKNKPPTDDAAKTKERSLKDFSHIIETALQGGRIDEKKASRLDLCLAAGDWSEVAYFLLCEQIPLKRKGKGYFCRICQEPKKGHSCPFCPICSTSEDRIRNDDDHVCFNCPVCFEAGKKEKKLVQITREGHVCPYEAVK